MSKSVKSNQQLLLKLDILNALVLDHQVDAWGKGHIAWIKSIKDGVYVVKINLMLGSVAGHLTG